MSCLFHGQVQSAVTGGSVSNVSCGKNGTWAFGCQESYQRYNPPVHPVHTYRLYSTRSGWRLSEQSALPRNSAHSMEIYNTYARLENIVAKWPIFMPHNTKPAQKNGRALGNLVA